MSKYEQMSNVSADAWQLNFFFSQSFQIFLEADSEKSCTLWRDGMIAGKPKQLWKIVLDQPIMC